MGFILVSVSFQCSLSAPQIKSIFSWTFRTCIFNSSIFWDLLNLQKSDSLVVFLLQVLHVQLKAYVFYHPLSDPSTEQLSHPQLLFEPMQLPSFSPRSRQCAVVISKAEQDESSMWNRRPSFSLLFRQKWKLSIIWYYWVFWDASCRYGPNLRQSCDIVCSFYFCEITKEL